MRKYLTVFFLFFSVVFSAISQDNPELNKLKKAYLNIQNENYREAYTYFRQMLETYPKEPVYNYYVGRCLLFMDKDPEISLNYLRFASTKEVPDDVYFYLGIAYLKDYQFTKALESFQWFEKSAGRKEIRDYNLPMYLSMVQNGIYLTRYIKEPLVYKKEVFGIDHFYHSYFFENLEGSFKNKNDFFDEPYDSTHFISVMFVPGKPDVRENLYFSAINEKRGDYDIYSVIRLTDTTWSEPENLGDVINTPFDDNFPFMHSDGSTLYFASKGHYSMGGYDLYKSTWNWKTQQWSEPENLDFPINSPFDDILFVPSPNKKKAYFASDRETEPGKIMVYTIKLSNADPYIEITNYDDLEKYARLEINATQTDDDRKVVSENYREGQHLVKMKNEESFLDKSEYDSLLNLAVHYQLKADSLRWVIDEKRLSFDETESGQDRVQLSNSIIELERKIYALQKKADQCYARVREIEQANLASQKMIYEYEPLKKNDVKEEKVQKIYVEPTIDSLNKSKLTAFTDKAEEQNDQRQDFGLQIKTPSVYDRNNPIPVNEDLTRTVVYMIQLGAFSTEKSPDVFKGLYPLSVVKSESSDIRKYYAGKFTTLTRAEEKLSLARAKGFKDAYVVAFHNNEIIPISKAIELEKDQPVTEKIVVKEDTKKENPNDLEIIFVLKGEVNTKDSTLIEMLKDSLSVDYELFMEEKEDKTIFTIKSFKSYDRALPVKKNVEAILRKEVEVHAYFAENQIPLDQARKITK